MEELLFWTGLAYTACGGLRLADDPALRGFWVDDFLPESAIDTKRGVDVQGTAWVGDGSRMHPYRFTASIPQKMLHRRRKSFSIERLDFDHARRALQVVISNQKHADCPS